MDRFLIAPFETGLQLNMKPNSIKASFCILYKYIQGGLMAKKYKLRKDIIDETGNKYGMLHVLKLSEKRSIRNPRGAYWDCLCECGNQCIVSGSHLRSHATRSCGCLITRNKENTGLNRLIERYEKRSYRAGMFFNLTREVFYKLIKGNCYYCGLEPQQKIKQYHNGQISLLYNGVDRLDSSRPYLPDNCVPCCKFCNRAKSDLSVEEFKRHIERIYKWNLIDS